MTTVTLYHSYDYECPNPKCRRRNFTMGVGDDQHAPEQVMCPHCLEEFETVVHERRSQQTGTPYGNTPPHVEGWYWIKRGEYAYPCQLIVIAEDEGQPRVEEWLTEEIDLSPDEMVDRGFLFGPKVYNPEE